MPVLEGHSKVLDLLLRAVEPAKRSGTWHDQLTALLLSGSRVDGAVGRWLLWSGWWQLGVMEEGEV